jgi:hypothetical protein
VFAKAGSIFRLQGQGFESARRFEMWCCCHIFAVAQNKFINRLRSSEAERNFRTGGHRYADK